jgi:hypothetical protein
MRLDQVAMFRKGEREILVIGGIVAAADDAFGTLNSFCGRSTLWEASPDADYAHHAVMAKQPKSGSGEPSHIIN